MKSSQKFVIVFFKIAAYYKGLWTGIIGVVLVQLGNDILCKTLVNCENARMRMLTFETSSY